MDRIPQPQPTLSLNGTTSETMSTEFTHNQSDHVYMVTTASVFAGTEHDDSGDAKSGSDERIEVDSNRGDIGDTIESDQTQSLTYPNETMEKDQKVEEIEEVEVEEKTSSGGNEIHPSKLAKNLLN